jgi:hypothetical protein
VNNLITILALNAGLLPDEQVKMFAESIIKACANYAFSDDQEYNAMLKNFGVENERNH